jgi:hypothetical protein
MPRRNANSVIGVLLILIGTLTLNACSLAGLGAAQTPDVKTILANLGKVQYKDIEFKVNYLRLKPGACESPGTTKRPRLAG